MARETKVGLLAGLAFIVCFAVILTNKGQRSAFRPSPQVVDAVHRSADPSPKSPQPTAGARSRPTVPVRARPHDPERSTGQFRPSHPPDVVDGDAVLEDWGKQDRRRRDIEIQRSARGGRVPRRTDQTRSTAPREPEPYGHYRSATPGRRDSFSPASTSLSSRQPVTNVRVVDMPGMEASPTGAYGVGAVSRSSAARHTSTDPVRQTAGGSVMTPPSRVPATSAPRRRARLATYTVAPGDTLSRIAAKHYGRASRANIDAIVKANRLTIADPDVLRAGAEIVLPALGVSSSSSSSSTESKRSAPHRSGPYRWYQIRPNDRYISIAREQLGDASRWREIHELNRDKFPDPGKIRTGVRIKLPQDLSASAGGRH